MEELGFLHNCCQHAIRGKGNFLTPTSINWQNLFRLAKKHRVRSLLLKGIIKGGYQAIIPPNFLARLKQINRSIANKNLRQTQELIQLNQLFLEAGITAVFYKGSLLASEAYKDLTAREFSDIDVLVHPADFPKIQQLLEARDYQAESKVAYQFFKKFSDQYYEYNFDYYENGVRIFHVEPHWTLGPKRYQIAFNLEDFSNFIIQKTIFGRPFNTFVPEGMLLSACMHHGGQDNWTSLKQISDVAAIIIQFEQTINWKLLLDTAFKWKVGNLLLLGLALAQQLLGTSLPPEINKKLVNPKVQRQLTKTLGILKAPNNQQRALRPILDRMNFHLSLRQSWLTRLKIIYYHLVQIILPTDQDIIGMDLNKINYFQLIFTKPFRLFKTYFKAN